MNWLHKNWLGIVLIMTLTTFVFWAIGYFANGLFGKHFDLASCWAGMGAIATGAVAGFGRWWVIGKYCSKEGEMPQ